MKQVRSFYETPSTEVFLLRGMENVCDNLSGNAPDYNYRSAAGLEWDDDE